MSHDLLVRLPNWVGDVCMALPALNALESVGFRLHLAGKGWTNDLLAGHGWSITPLPKPFGEARKSLAAVKVRDGLLLTNSLGSALQFRLAGVRAVGHAAEGRSLLLARALAKPSPCHEVQVFWRLAQATATHHGLLLPESPPTALGLRLTEAHHAQATAALANIPGPFVALAPLAAGTINGQPKLWPGFPLLARLLTSEGIALVACPGPGEEAATVEAVPGARLLPGLKLGAYAAVLTRALVTVANDSGPMHLAAATGSPVIGLFGVSDPARTRPWQGTALGSPTGWPRVEDVMREILGRVRPQ